MNPFTQPHSVCFRLSVWALVLLGCAAPPLVHAKLVQEIIKIPMTVSNAYGKEETRDVVVTVFVDNATPAPHPIMVIGHGRAAEAEKRIAMGRWTQITNATWFSKMSFLVAVPTRIGYGVTGGEDLEDSGTCARKNYPPGYAAAAVQTLKVLDVMRQRSDTAKDRAIVVGQSFGGATAITVAAQNPAGVQATINFAGGGGGNPETMPQNPCGQPALKTICSSAPSCPGNGLTPTRPMEATVSLPCSPHRAAMATASSAWRPMCGTAVCWSFCGPTATRIW